MGKVNLPNVVQKRGLLYFRVQSRHNGKRIDQYIRLPALTDPGFHDAYRRLADGTQVKREGAAPGSLEALIIEYRAALPNRRTKRGLPLSPVTLANYRRDLDLLVEHFGRAPVRHITAPDVIEMQDAFADRPGVANNMIARLRGVLEFGRLRGWLTVNPAVRIPQLALGEHAPWPAEVIAAVMQAGGPMVRLAAVTLLCSGWRDGDAIRIRHNWFRDGFCTVERQGKTGVTASVPVHPMWSAEIDRLPKRALTLLYDRSGKPFSSPEPLQAALRRLMTHEDVRAAIAEAASRGECDADDTFVWHGLRKNACCYLTELGLSDSQVGGMQGMSPEMVRYYSRRRRTLMLAKSGEAAVLGGNVVGLWQGPEGTAAAAGGNST
jgi:hypothetical protein